MLEALHGALILGSLGFFLLIAVVSVLILAAVEYERAGLATITLIAAFTALAFFGDFNILIATREHPFHAASAIVGYFVIGVAWSIGKWWFFCDARRAKYRDFRAQYVAAKCPDLRPEHERPGYARRRSDEATPEVAQPAEVVDKAKFIAFCESNGGSEYSERRHKYHRVWERPKAREHKSRIMTWMAYWPWSMVWTLLSDPAKRIWRWLYRRVQGIFEAIANRAYRGIDEAPSDPG